MRWYRRAIGVVAVFLSAFGAARVDGGPVLKREFLFEAAPFPSCHASTLAESGGDLVAAWFGGTHERHPDVGIWVSRLTPVDGDWSEPVEIANGVTGDERFPTWNPVLFQPKRGPLLLFYKVGPTPRDWWGMLKTSDDGGQTWGPARRLPEGFLGPIKNKPLELADGALLCPSSTEHDGWRVHFERTPDLGATWERMGSVESSPEVQAIQPSLLRHSQTRLQALGRTRDSGIFQTWSEDNGRTWGPLTTTGLPNPSSGTDAVTLADGRHVLVYNHNTHDRGRSPLNVAVSDDGRAWRAALVLEDDPDAPDGFAYPAVIQTSDGLVHVSYTWQRKRVRHVVLDPTHLDGPQIVDGFWPVGPADQP